MMHLAAAILLTLAQNNDKAQANGYDDAWKSQWKTHLQSVLSTSTVTKTAGFVLQVGDSITHANQYSQWPRAGNGVKSSEDVQICTWAMTSAGFPITNHNDPNATNGFYLSAADTRTAGNRGMTAAGGIAAYEFLSGSGNDSSTDIMPSTGTTSTAKTYVSDPNLYDNNLHITTVAAAFNVAQFAVVMLGTNDVTGRTTAQFNTDLGNIVTALENQHIGVILSTIPPYIGQDVTAYNTAIRAMAQARSLPLIDFYAEILARRPGTSWQGTLIQAAPDNRHPTYEYPAGGATYNSASSPYVDGGDANTHKTGAACANVGYLLRSWLTIQKLKEVQSFVISNNPAVPSNPVSPTPGPGPSPTPTASTPKSNGGGGGKCGGSIGGPVSPWTLVGAALAALALLAATRKTGF